MTVYNWRVTHPTHGTVDIQAPDRLSAVRAAAKAYGVVQWTTIARALEIEKLGEVVPEPEKKRRSRRAKSIKKAGGR